MGMLNFLKRASEIFTVKKRTAAIILAAGTGERFGSQKKQFISLSGTPVICKTLEIFENCSAIDDIVVVTHSEDIDYCNKMLDNRFSKLKNVTAGGASRQESARAGLEALDPSVEYVAIHDAARCLITTEIIETVCKEAIRYGAAAAAEKAVDTVKYADSNGFIDSTIDRDHVWLVKTPQVFLANMYRAGIYTSVKDKINATDDCMLVERLGFKVKLVDCGHDNIKLTYPEDLIIAEAILKNRGN